MAVTLMYVSRGHTVKLTDASRLPLDEAIRELLRMGDARLVYYAPDGSVYELEVSSRGRAGCVAQLPGGRVLYGTECLQSLAKHLHSRQGVIELVELDAQRVRTDFITLPQSLLPMGVEEVRRLIGEAQPARQQPQAAAPAAPSPQPRQAAATAAPAAAAPPAAQAAAPAQPAPVPAPPAPGVAGAPTVSEQLRAYLSSFERRGLRPSDSFNILAAAAVAVSGREVEAQGTARPCLDIVSDLLVLRGRAVVDCRGDGARIVVLLDTARGRVEALLQRGDREATGLPALEEAARLRPDAVKVFLQEQR